jgi:hypothetical protein
MVSRISGISLILGCLFLATPKARALEVIASATTGGSYDLTAYSNWVHFTANANNGASVDATLSGGIPNVTESSGTAFSGFTDTFTNGAGGTGEISAADNANAVNVQYASGPLSNSRIWFGTWGSTEGVSFNLTVPAASGQMLLFSAGSNSAAAGGASLAASFTSPAESQSATFTAGAIGSWGALFTVNWTGRTVGDVMSLQFANVPAGSPLAGNAGLIAVVVPEPSTYVMAGLASAMMAGIRLRRKARSKVRFGT